MPKRIQRKRTKGWRMPENAVYVGRPTNWGNPYKVGDLNPWTLNTVADLSEAVGLYAQDWSLMIEHSVARPAGATDAIDAMLLALRGKDLACWCPLDQPCHADVLLDLANREARP